MTTVLILFTLQLLILASMSLIAMKMSLTKKVEAILKWLLIMALILGVINELILLFFYSEFTNLVKWISK